MSKLSVLILDDEEVNVYLLKKNLEIYYKKITKIYSATNIDDAVLLYLEHQPEILFLDVQLDAQKTSFDFLARIPNENFQVIFITSYPEFAIKAINESNIAGYLLKPYKVEELIFATNRAVEILNILEAATSPKNNIEDERSEFIAISLKDRIEIIPQINIVYVEADGRFTNFYLKNKSLYRSGRNIGLYEKQLNPHIFFRIHHATIINVNEITMIDKTDGHYCEIKGYNPLLISVRKRAEFYQFLNLKKK